VGQRRAFNFWESLRVVAGGGRRDSVGSPRAFFVRLMILHGKRRGYRRFGRAVAEWAGGTDQMCLSEARKRLVGRQRRRWGGQVMEHPPPPPPPPDMR